MKSYFLYPIILILSILGGCSKDPSTQYSEDKNKSGAVFFKIDKENAPSNVVKVLVYLSREEYETLTGELNLISATTGDMFFENVVVGEWHINVNALNEEGVVVYSGETTVTVLDGKTTNINLVLTPTGQGYGNIYIYVTWGKIENKWFDYPNNPLLTTTNSYWDKYGPNQPKLLFEDGIYHMWFGNLVDAGGSYVGYAYSSSGKSWIRPVSYPVLSPGTYDEWDYGRAGVGPVIKKDSIFIMYYNGWGEQSGLWQVGIAFSSDGIIWEKSPNPVLSGNYDGDDARINANFVLKKDNKYYMYYTYGTIYGTNYKIGLAISNDGFNWEKYSNNPILDVTEVWEAPGIGQPTIVQENNFYKMIYSNASNSPLTAFGIATSKDCIYWEKEINNPSFTDKDSSITWDLDKILFPYAIKVNSEYRIYYTGYKEDNIGGPGEYKIGLISKTQ